MSTGLVLTSALLDTSLAWKIHQVRLARRNRPLIAVTACIAFAAASLSLSWPSESRAVVSLLGTGSAELLANAFLLVGAYALVCFYLYSTAGGRRAARRVRIEAVPMAAGIAVITAATITMPPGDRGRSYPTADMSVPQVELFFATTDLYLVYALATAARWTVPLARRAGRPLSTGLWLTAAALAGMVTASAIRVVNDTAYCDGGRVPAGLDRCASLLLAVALPLFVVGMSYSSAVARLTALRVWYQHRRAYRKLAPLWTALYGSFPEVALSRAPDSRWPMALRGHGVHRRYYRRVVECRDGLVRISPRLARLGVRQGTPPAVVARKLRIALRAHAMDEPVGSGPSAVATPPEDSLDADVRELVSVSQALRAADTARPWRAAAPDDTCHHQLMRLSWGSMTPCTAARRWCAGR